MKPEKIAECLRIIAAVDSDNTWEWERMDIEETEDGPYVYVPECAYLGDTLIVLTDTYENSGNDCLYVQTACKEFPGAIRRIQELEAECERLEKWKNDLLSGMTVNCVYCGHCYGPKSDTPVSMAEVLKEHISICPEHPLSHANTRIKELETEVASLLPHCKRD